MAEHQLNLIGDIKAVEGEIEGVLQCEKCRELSVYIFEQHSKFHPLQDFNTCNICYPKKFNLALLHL